MEPAKIEIDKRAFETIAQYREGAINRDKALELLAPFNFHLISEVLEHATVTAFIDGEWKVAGVGVPSLKPDDADNRVTATDAHDA